ncbi:uncharacterized protein [Physcomitrium patens]|uniref:Rubredoxin-like domain-containing protein n=1 Tax=Physcomitrium patens TaxID=3218 RepID=A0A2K1JZ67_PHYPA|nr:uncharacterized protein LOC112287366 [Physcomitrium patens]PNR46810.1 hypothetical protein PHYPA_013930 [Physcomitrium patens]|eukprot:XP_024386075.1 uncharacterized protein LOC112287366 [Physcomitrella patens]
MATASISGSKVVFSTQVPLAQAPTVEQKTSVAFKKPAALSSGQIYGLGASGSLANKNELRIARASSNSRQAPRLRLEVTAKTAGAAKQFETEVDKPLGLVLGQNPGGRVVITQVDARGNAAKAGLKVGDQVIYTSSFFGDELWPADKLGFTKTAINAKPDSVYFVVARGADVDVKRLPKRPAPPRFGRKLTDAQKARATHVCLDCGYIYTLSKSFDDQPEDWQCPQCQAPKKRFAGYDPETGRTIGGQATPIPVLLGVVFGAAAIGAILFFGLQ